MKPSSGSAATVFVDADNTLWDTDRVFAAAQSNLLANVERSIGVEADARDRLAFVRSLDQAIAERHHLGLRYPPRLLIRALAHALGGAMAERAARSAWLGDERTQIADEAALEIERAFFADIAHPPRLRPGVLRGMATLFEAGCQLLIVTEGARAKVESTARKLKLEGHFTRILEGRKRPEFYRRVLRLIGTPDAAFMIGDQLDRDIAPAKVAGLETIYFPGSFKPRWKPDEEAIGPDHRVSSFAEVPRIVLTQTGTARASGLF